MDEVREREREREREAKIRSRRKRNESSNSSSSERKYTRRETGNSVHTKAQSASSRVTGTREQGDDQDIPFGC